MGHASEQQQLRSKNSALDVQPLLDGRKLVFIGGLHRSGTSLIHRCLSGHADVSAFSGTGVPEDEGQHLQTVYKRAHDFGGAGRFGFHSAAALDERSPLVSNSNAEKLLSEWVKYWDQSRQVLIEKSPPNLIRTRFLQALFPNCRFVIVQRHPIAVSCATQKWYRRRLLRWTGRGALHALVAHWLVCHERFEADRASLKNVFVLRYEEFVAEPQPQFDALLRFLGLSGCPVAREIRPNVNEGYYASWEGRRRTLLGRAYIELVVRRFEQRVRRFGYSLRDYRMLLNQSAVE